MSLEIEFGIDILKSYLEDRHGDYKPKSTLEVLKDRMMQLYQNIKNIINRAARALALVAYEDKENEEEECAIHRLNDDCMLHIFNFLPVQDKIRLQTVCTRWKVLGEEALCRTSSLFIRCSIVNATGTETGRDIIARTISTHFDTKRKLKRLLLKCGKSLKMFHFERRQCCRDETLSLIPEYCCNLVNMKISSEKFLNDFHTTGCYVNEANSPKRESIYGMYDEIFADIADNCQKITTLDISAFDDIYNTGLRAIATLPKLKYLYINNLYKISDEGLKYLKNLKELECRATFIKGIGLQKVIENSPDLEKLDISCCHRVPTKVFYDICSTCHNRKIKLVARHMERPVVRNCCLHISHSRNIPNIL